MLIYQPWLFVNCTGYIQLGQADFCHGIFCDFSCDCLIPLLIRIFWNTCNIDFLFHELFLYAHSICYWCECFGKHVTMIFYSMYCFCKIIQFNYWCECFITHVTFNFASMIRFICSFNLFFVSNVLSHMLHSLKFLLILTLINT